MNRLIVAVLAVLPSLSSWARDNVSTSNPIVTGRVTEQVPGYAYLRGREGKIVSVETSTGIVHLFVPQTGIEVGEEVVFSGPMATVANWAVVDSTEGSLYRPAGRTVHEQIQDQMKVQAAQEEQQPAHSIIDDESLRAVPISMVETKEQREEKRAQAADDARDRRLNLLLSILGILLALLAIERLPRLVQLVIKGIAKGVAIVHATKRHFTKLSVKDR